MRCHTVRLVAAVLMVGAVLMVAGCSSGSSKPATPTTSSIAVTTTTATVTAQSTSTTVPAPATVATTTTACPAAGGSTAAVSTGPPKDASLLLTVSVNSTSCVDRVVFGFASKSVAPPSCDLSYRTGPFSQDGSGKPVTVAGAAFVVVRCERAYGYDFEAGKATYTGPKHITSTGTRHVQELAETGDFEGVVSWVVGLDAKRPFRVTAKAIPPGFSTLVVAFS